MIEEKKIGEVRHIGWFLSKPVNTIDISKTYNWHTDIKVAQGGYFDDLASYEIELFIHLLGDIINAQGIAFNQHGLYIAMDGIKGKTALHTTWVLENILKKITKSKKTE